jgi:hypothetical protein
LRLASVIVPNLNAWRTAAKNDIRSFDNSLLTGDDNTAQISRISLASTSSLWGLLIAITLVAERVVSYRRKQ